MADRLFDNRIAPHSCTPSCRGASPAYRSDPLCPPFKLSETKEPVRKKQRKAKPGAAGQPIPDDFT